MRNLKKQHDPDSPFAPKLRRSTFLFGQRIAFEKEQQEKRQKEREELRAKVENSVLCFEVSVRGTWFDVHRLKDTSVVILRGGDKFVRPGHRHWKDVMRVAKDTLDRYEVKLIMNT